MVIAQTADHYAPPKKHPKYGKWIQILEGELSVVTFSDSGSVLTNDRLKPQQSFGCYIARGVYHMNFPLSNVAVFLEAVAGPFVRQDSNLNAEWAPSGADVRAAKRFRDALLLD